MQGRKREMVSTHLKINLIFYHSDKLGAEHNKSNQMQNLFAKALLYSCVSIKLYLIVPDLK